MNPEIVTSEKVSVKNDKIKPLDKVIETLKKYLGEDFLFDIGADAAGIFIPGGGIVVKSVKRIIDTKRSKNKSALSLIINKQDRNIESIIVETIKLSNIESLNIIHNQGKKQIIEEDWLNSFFDNAKNISGKELQTLWARILAGEIIQPGSFSLRTFDTLRNLTSEEATIFNRLVKYSFQDQDGNNFIIINKSEHLDKAYAFDFNNKQTFSETGLIHSEPQPLGERKVLNSTNADEILLNYGNYEIIIQRGTNDVFAKDLFLFVNVRTLAFTNAGNQLSKFIDHNNDTGLLEEIGKDFSIDGSKVRFRKLGTNTWTNV